MANEKKNKKKFSHLMTQVFSEILMDVSHQNKSNKTRPIKNKCKHKNIVMSYIHLLLNRKIWHVLDFFFQGHPLRSVLLLLREMDGNVYKQLQVDFQRYAGCIGIVDTGYFKRSPAPDSFSKRTPQSSTGHNDGLELFKTWTNR